MTTSIYTSQIAAQALNLQPLGEIHTGEDTCCAMCERPIKAGDISSPLKSSTTFTDWLALSPSKHVCGWCNATTSQDNMRQLQRAVITPSGVYPMGKDAHRTWFLLTPPEPPYAVVISTGSALAVFHMHWRTPVTLSNDLVMLRIDELTTSIRRKVLERAIGQCRELAMLAHEAKPTGKRKAKATEPRNHPFISLDRSLADPMHGRLRDDAINAARIAGRMDLVEALQQLSTGELWALATLVKAKPEQPIKPDLITSPKASAAEAA